MSNRVGDRAYSNRWGRFRMSGHYYEAIRGQSLDSDHAKSLMAIMGQMIILRAHDCPWGDGVDYWAVSPLFDELGEGEMIPWYGLEWQTVDHGDDYTEEGHANQFEMIFNAVKRKPPGETW